MDTNKLILKDEVFAIIGAAMDVLNEIGCGYHEKPYENALAIELRLRNIPFKQQPQYALLYKGISVGSFIPDFVAFNQIIVDTKTIPRITDHERGQIINYLKATGCRLGLIINFHQSKLEWERIIL